MIIYNKIIELFLKDYQLNYLKYSVMEKILGNEQNIIF